MKLNKLLILFAGVALMFTACKKDVEREPSPAFPEEVAALYFPSADERGAEIDPSEGIYKSTVTIARRDSVGELTVALKVVRNDSNIFKVPESVTFADQVKSVDFEISFEGAKDGVTYNLIIETDGAQVNPYMEGAATYLYSVTPIKWIPAEKPAIFDGNVFGAAYGVPEAYWYVPYEYAELGGGALRCRFKNAYASAPSAADEWGIYDGFPFNDPGDWHAEQDWITVIDISKDGVVDMASHQIGVEWSYGMFSIGLACNYTGDYEKYSFGEYEDGVVTFAAGQVFLDLPTKGVYLTRADHHIWIDSDVLIDAIKEANSAVRLSNFEDGFNDAGIKWNEVEGEYKRFVTSAFNENGDAWTQPLLNAVDPNVELNPDLGAESDFYNLYMLPNLYEEGFGLAFYYDSIKGTVKLPNVEQPTGVSLAGKALLFAPTADKESFTEVVNIKGTDVTLFHFFVDLVTEDGITFGSYEELFYFSVDPIIFTVEDFTGNYLASGSPLLQGGSPLVDQPVEIKSVEDNIVEINGLDLADGLAGTIDFATGVLSIAPQPLAAHVEAWDEVDEETGDTVHYEATYSMLFLTYAGGVSQTEPLRYNKPNETALELTDASAAIGYLIYGSNIEDSSDAGYFDGYHHVVFAPAPAAAAPAKKAASHHQISSALMQIKVGASGKAISTSHLHNQGKRARFALQPNAAAL